LSQPHWISDIEFRLQLQHPIRTSRCDQRFHNARWNRMGPLSMGRESDPRLPRLIFLSVPGLRRETVKKEGRRCPSSSTDLDPYWPSE
jgi:hypothetical protein